MLEHGGGIDLAAVNPIVEYQPRRSVGKQSMELEFALLKRLAPQILAVKLDQIEGKEKRMVVSLAMKKQVE